MKLFLSAIVYIFLCGTFASASADWERFTQIKRVTMASDGYLTKNMHKEFWVLINKNIKNKAQKEEFIEGVKGTLPFSLAFQMESWKSALLSYDNKQVVKTSKLINYIVSISTFKSKKNPQQDAIVRALQRNIIKINDLLSKIAKRKPLIVDGKEKYMDRDEILFTLQNLHNSKRRLNRLFNEKWEEDVLIGSELDNIMAYNKSLPFMTDKETKTMLIVPEQINNQLVFTYYHQLFIDNEKLPPLNFMKEYLYNNNCKYLKENEILKQIYFKKDFSSYGEIYMSKKICKAVAYFNKKDITGFKKYIYSITAYDYFNLHLDKKFLSDKFFKAYQTRLLDIDLSIDDSETPYLNHVLR